MRNLIKKVIVLLLALSILMLPEIQVNASLDAKTTFKDVKVTSWYYSYVAKLADLKITGGYTDGTYKPDNPVTRAEFVTFLCNVKGYKQMQGNPFVDSQNSWASGYITAALANGIMDLPSDQKFNPNFAITRSEAVEMMCRALNISADEETETPYTDVKDKKGYSTAAYSNYLMQGSLDKDKRYFYPGTKITRAEVATIIVNAYDYNVDKMAYLNKRIEEEKAKKEEAETKAKKHQAWLDSIDKGVSQELLNNVDGLSGGKTVEECNEYAINTLKTEYTAWWKDSKVTNGDDFIKEFLRVGRVFSNMYYNRDFRKLTDLENGLRENWSPVNVENYLDDILGKTTQNKVVENGQLFTGEGLMFLNNGSPVLRGTLKYKYLKPTSSTMFKNDICVDTKKPCEYDVWYSVDIEIVLTSENGIKADSIREISKVRLWR